MLPDYRGKGYTATAFHLLLQKMSKKVKEITSDRTAATTALYKREFLTGKLSETDSLLKYITATIKRPGDQYHPV